jgi:putative transposase
MTSHAASAGLPQRDQFALLHLLPVSDRDKDVEILVLRHQITMLERQLGKTPLRFFPADRAFFAALLHRLPPNVLRQLQLPIRPETVLRWHRELVTHRHAAKSRPTRLGRPRTVRSIRLLVLRRYERTPPGGYRRIHGELLVLGITIAASTVWQILKDAGVDPAPDRTSSTWADFLRSQAEALLACDFFEVPTLSGTRLCALAVIEHTSRRIRVLGATAHPTAAWVSQAAKNLVMDLEDASRSARFLIRDRDGKFPALFDVILADAGIQIVLSGVRIPRMNAIMERWIKTCRRELLDHTLREYEQSYNTHRPHQDIANARPLHPLPQPTTHQAQNTDFDIRRHQRLGGILNEYHHAARPARTEFSASTGSPNPAFRGHHRRTTATEGTSSIPVRRRPAPIRRCAVAAQAVSPIGQGVRVASPAL